MPEAQITTTKVAVGEYEFQVNESGDRAAAPVLFLHGSGPGATGLSNWEAVIKDLGNDYYCLAPDVIGFGDSTHPENPPQGLAPFTQLRIDTPKASAQFLARHLLGHTAQTTQTKRSLSGGLAVIGPQDAPGVLDEPPLLGEGSSEEQGIQRGAVEPFPGLRAGGNRQQRRAAGLRLEPGERGCPVLGAHAAAQDDGIVA
jgi:2-hydroxymuconate-semialdehyde hydrolase